MSRYRVDLAGGEVVETPAEDEALYREFAEQSGLENWLSSKGLDQETTRKGVDLSEGENQGEEAKQEGRPFFSPDEFFRLAAEEDAELPEHMREDAELQDELRRQSHDDAFGEDPADSLSDDDLWRQYRQTLGEEA
jgi:hypothetical protein